MRCEVPVPGRPAIVLDDGVLAPHRSQFDTLGETTRTRLAYAATRIVMQDGYASVPHSLASPGSSADIAAAVDWTATLELRRRLDGLGFAIAEAMDTAQRFDIGWNTARELIERCGALRLANGFVAGAGTDHLPGVESEDALVDAVVHQARVIQEAGGEVILLPLPWLCSRGYGAGDFVRVYDRIIARLEGPLYVHWLGAMFLPSLAGYFPEDSFRRVMDLDPAKVRGAKLSLLDGPLEVRLRREIAANDQILLTGDDFHFARLILGGDLEGRPSHIKARGAVTIGSREVATGDFSHALLGVLDGIAEPAALALRALDAGDHETYLAIMEPCEELGRWLFQSPTRHYKAGLAFLSWLNGHQDQPMLANHEERSRDIPHYIHAAELASRAGVLRDAELVAERLERWLATHSWSNSAKG